MPAPGTADRTRTRIPGGSGMGQIHIRSTNPSPSYFLAISSRSLLPSSPDPTSKKSTTSRIKLHLAILNATTTEYPPSPPRLPIPTYHIIIVIKHLHSYAGPTTRTDLDTRPHTRAVTRPLSPWPPGTSPYRPLRQLCSVTIRLSIYPPTGLRHHRTRP